LSLEKADICLNNIAYDLLLDERYDLAKIILKFANQTIKKYSSEEMRRIFLINEALAYKFSSDKKKLIEIIEGEDWSATGDRFKLAIAIIKDNIQEAIKIMKKIGENGEVKKIDYKDWPLFKDIKGTKEFQETYEKIFGEPYIVMTDISDKPIDKKLK